MFTVSNMIDCSNKVIINTMTIKNSIWDGQSLMDISLFGEYKNFGMLLLRNRFFKSCCFNTNIQKWFKDNKITDITQLNGYTIAKDIKDIKLITTPSSIKYLKFGSKEEWISNIEPLFGVVKHEKKTHNFDGRMVQTHYQLLNTLQLSEDEMVEFLKPSLDYLHLLKTDPSIVRYYIKYPENIKFEITPLVSKNDIVYKLLGLNDKFAKTKLYYDFKNDLTKSYVKNLRCGHVLVNGNYSTLLSCPIEMLQSAIFKFKGDSILGVGNIHSKNFEYNKQILCSRSPHVTIGNILVTNNISCDIVDEYCNLTKEIVCINTINENILERLSSADMDSDTMLMTDNDTLVKAALKNYSNFKVPTNNVESLKKNRKYTSVEKADLDFKTSDNKIGEIINLSQELNTLLWHEMNNGKEIPELQDLYNDICQLDVMSCIEIDKAKKEFIVNTYKEMQKIRDKWIENDDIGRKIKPNFFGHLAKTKGYYDSKKKNYKRHDTSMDYLQKIINQFQLSRLQKNNIAFEPFSTIINFDGYNTKNIKYDQVKRIVSLIKDTNTKIKSLYSSDEYDKDTKYKLFSEARQKCTEYIGKLSFSKSTMIYMLSLFDSNEYKHISRIFMNTLFGYPNTSFYRIIKESTEPIELLIENKEGNIKVFDMNFTKTYKN
jgi:hypothetical protein